MTLDRKRRLLVQDQSPHTYIDPCDLNKSWHFPSCQSVDTAESNKSNSQIYKDLQGEPNGDGQLHLTNPPHFDPSHKRPRGRPKGSKNLQRARRRKPAWIVSKKQAPNETLAESNYQSLFQSEESPLAEQSFLPLLDMSGGWVAWQGDNLPFDQHDLGSSVGGTPGSSTSATHQETGTIAMHRGPRQRRSTAARIDRRLERTTYFNLLMKVMNPDNQTTQRNPWVQNNRVLETMRVPRSYIWESCLRTLRYTYHPIPRWKVPTHLGELSVIGVVPIIVTKQPDGFDRPFSVDFYVVQGEPRPEGVDIIIGSLDITEAFGRDWRPDWSAEQYVAHGTGRGWDTSAEISGFSAMMSPNQGNLTGGGPAGWDYSS